MTNYEYSKIATPSEKAMDTIECVFDELHITECEKKVFIDMFTSLIRKERTEAAIEYNDIIRYNH